MQQVSQNVTLPQIQSQLWWHGGVGWFSANILCMVATHSNMFSMFWTKVTSEDLWMILATLGDEQLTALKRRLKTCWQPQIELVTHCWNLQWWHWQCLCWHLLWWCLVKLGYYQVQFTIVVEWTFAKLVDTPLRKAYLKVKECSKALMEVFSLPIKLSSLSITNLADVQNSLIDFWIQFIMII